MVDTIDSSSKCIVMSLCDCAVWQVPGQPNYIDLSAFDVSVPEAEPPEQLAKKLSMLLLEALDGLSPARLALKAFCEAGKFQHNKPNVDQAAENNSTGAGPEQSLYEPSEASRKPAVQVADRAGSLNCLLVIHYRLTRALFPSCPSKYQVGLPTTEVAAFVNTFVTLNVSFADMHTCLNTVCLSI